MEDKDMIEFIALWCIVTAEENTENCSWVIYHDEIAERFKVSDEWIRKNHTAIADAILAHSDIVAELDHENAKGKNPDDHYFDLDLDGNYCDVDTDED